MKKVFFALVALVASMSLNAQIMKVMKGETVVATYSSSYVDKVVFEETSGPTTGTAKATIEEEEVDVTWVQLWAGGPKFATYNVGVTDGKAESYGGYYAWCGNINKNNSDYNTGTDVLTGNADTATNLWGSNWRMPTEEELYGLINNCDVVWTTVNDVKGYKFTGKGDYSSNSVFLPAAGNCDGGYVNGAGYVGIYWSSSPNSSVSACSLYFNSDDQLVYSSSRNSRSSGYSVRAVLAEVPTTGTAKATIEEEEVDVTWVQLWKNGPKFAAYNVGVTDGKAESYGGYYCWGKAIDKDPNNAYKEGTSALSGDDDTATKFWGNKWRMPTQAELQGLLRAANCDVEWTTINGVKGYKFTGKGDYSSNSVFLPAAGHYDYGDVHNTGDNGCYWSSTPMGSDGAYSLDFTSGYQYVIKYDRDLGYSVRAVLKE